MDIRKLKIKICKMRHAVNVFNVNKILPNVGITVDEGLVRMAQLSKEKDTYKRYRLMPDEKLDTFADSDAVVVRNFPIQDAKDVYNKICDELTKIQTDLDTVNSTVTFSVDIEE